MAAALPASAQVAVEGIQRAFLPGERPIQNVPVKNTSTDQIFRIESRVRLADKQPDGTEILSETQDIRIAPSTFILRPGEERIVRLMLTKPADKDKERAYRISFMPATPPKDEQSERNAISAGVTVLTTMGLYVTVVPQNMQPNLTYTRDASGITFRNEGNVSVELKRISNFCFDEEKTDCMMLPGQWITPGFSWRLDIPAHRHIHYFYKVYEDASKIDIPPYQGS